MVVFSLEFVRPSADELIALLSLRQSGREADQSVASGAVSDIERRKLGSSDSLPFPTIYGHRASHRIVRLTKRVNLD